VLPRLHELRGRLRAWVTSLDGLADAEPTLPVEDRDADKWEPLVALADAAGGRWPEMARRACEVLCGQGTPDDGTAGERLLADLSSVWTEEEDLFTSVLLGRLHVIEESPWPDWYGHPLNPRDLARLLRPYGLASTTIRRGRETAKGYKRAEVQDAWTRYVTAVTPSQEVKSAGQARDGNVTDGSAECVTPVEQQEQATRDAVTFVTRGYPASTAYPENDYLDPEVRRRANYIAGISTRKSNE
jgi:hypothetical protein